ncbi:protein of unknown function [Pseudomonas sp. JV551A1]|nr:protein of unknown function [Pseudomonas sp. JV551A1]
MRHRFCAGFSYGAILWERPCVAKGARSGPRYQH